MSQLVAVLLSIAVALLSLTPAFGAPGEPPKRVLLIERGADPFLERVGAEVAGLGFVVVRSEARGALEDAARAEHAVAAIRMLPSRKGVEVWMSDATSGRSLLRQMIVDESPGGPNQALVALQTAELLRTSLLIAPASPAAPASAATSSPAAANVSPPTPPGARPEFTPKSSVSAQEDTGVEPAGASGAGATDAGLQAGFGVLYSPGGANAALQLALSLHRALGRRFAVALDLGLPLKSATLSGPEGSVGVGTYFAGAGLLMRWRSEPLYASAGLGAALLRITFEGDARSPLVSRSESTVTVAGYLRGDAGFEPASFLRLGVRGMLGASADRVAVRFAGNDAGHWGHLFVAAFALGEIQWR